MKYSIICPERKFSTGVLAFTTESTHAGRPISFKGESADEARRRLEEEIGVSSVFWLPTAHTVQCVKAGSAGFSEDCAADAALIEESGVFVGLTTADCLPIMLISETEKKGAIVHAGWRGLAGGIIPRVIESMSGVNVRQLFAWIGPSIAMDDYEVGEEVVEALTNAGADREAHFRPSGRQGRYFADLRAIAVFQLQASGLQLDMIEVFAPSTAADPRLHSVRRDGDTAGRMASILGFLD